MRRIRRLAARYLLGATLVFCPLAVHALGLGKLKIHSALHEPLNAEIEFTAITDAELKGLNATLASPAEFRAAGAERLPFLSQIKFNVVRRPDGRYFLELTTDQPIAEPFMHLLVQLDWAGGRLVREYTALIDPPQYAAATPPRVETPQVAPPVETVPPPLAEPELALSAEPSAVEPMTEPPLTETMLADRTLGPDTSTSVRISPETGWPEEGYEAPPTVEALAPIERQEAVAGTPGWAHTSEYVVQRGDTLWAIAERVRADQGLTLEQVMVAIFRNNKSAFFRNNLNNLRAGKILTLPEREEVQSIDPLQARAEFRAQYDAWQEYKLKLAAASRSIEVADSAPVEAAETQAKAASASAEPEKAAEASATTASKTPEPAIGAQQPDELLKIVRSTLDAEKSRSEGADVQGESPIEAAKREQAALAERVTTLEESLESRQMENRELAEKVGQVREQLKNEKRLLELESQELAQAQARAQKKPAEAAPTEDAKPAEAKPDTAAAPAAAQAPAPAKPAAKAPKKRVAPPPPPPAPEKGFIQTFVDDFVDGGLMPVIGGAVVLIGGVILLVYLRRRRRSIAEFEESILASDAIAPDSTATTGAPTDQAITTGDTSFLSDFSQGGVGHVQTDEVDPIAEAEVYLAYGRDETAEEILKEAIVKNPTRQELKLKLLEIYHQRNDVAAFETLAEELYAALGGGGGKIWEKVEEMGRRLSPNNPMFQGGAGDRRATDKAPRGNDAVSSPVTATPVLGGAAGEAAESGESTSTIDFDFDTDTRAAPESSAAMDLDFDLDEAKTGTDDAGLDFSAGPVTGEAQGLAALDLGQPSEHVIDFEQAKAESAADDGIRFELPGDEQPAGRDEISFDFSAETAAATEESAESAIRFEPTSVGGDGEIQWELDAAEAATSATETAAAPEDGEQAVAEVAAEPQWDEIATKLDLARAYIDMGDAEGARSILEEVMAEGNDQQKKQAADLASQIGSAGAG